MNRKAKKYSQRLENEERILKETAETARNSDLLISNLGSEFEEMTKLDKKDIAFLITATAIQCIRQYVIAKLSKRVDDKTAAEMVKGDVEEHSNRKHRYYNPSLAEVISNPVPFDANIGSDGVLRGGGRMGHRVKTVGHDPILGLIFGTANIATSTLTTVPDFQSYHITTGLVKTGMGFGNKDVFYQHARTDLVLKYTVKKLLSKKADQIEIVAVALLKEIIHLQSDRNTKNSLPIPFISAVSPKLSSKLGEIGIDMANVHKFGKQAEIAVAINVIIAMLYRLCYNDNEFKEDLFKVKLKKILNYSNIIASSSNIVAVGVGSAIGIASDNPKMIKKSISYLDIGGIAVAISQLFIDQKKIYEIKREFMKNEWYKTVKGE